MPIRPHEDALHAFFKCSRFTREGMVLEREIGEFTLRLYFVARRIGTDLLHLFSRFYKKREDRPNLHPTGRAHKRAGESYVPLTLINKRSVKKKINKRS